MRTSRLFVAATAASVTAALCLPTPARAASTGSGSADGRSTAVSVSLGQAGSLLRLDVLDDTGKASIDPTKGTPIGSSNLALLGLSSQTVPAINALDDAIPTLATSSTGAADTMEGPAVPLNVPGVANGSLFPFKLSSVVDADGARSGLAATLANLNLAGGLVSVESLASTLGADAAPSDSQGLRGVALDNVAVLNLGQLLDGLGIDLGALPLDDVLASLAAAGLPVGSIPAADVAGLVAQLEAVTDQINDLSAICAGLPALPAELGTALGTLNGALPVDVPVPTDCAGLAATLTAVVGQLTDLLGGAMTGLADLSVLRVDTVEAGLKALATDQLSSSASDVTGKLSGISVLGQTLPVVDVLGTAQQLTATLDSATSRLDSVLGPLGLAGVIELDLLRKTTGLSTVDGYNKAVTGLTGLVLSITPPANLTSLISSLVPADGLASSITDLGGTVPAVANLDALQTALGGSGVQALASGATVTLADLGSTSDFAAAVGSTTPGASPNPLPRTGGSAPVAIGGALLIAAVAMRRLVMRAATVEA